MEMFEQEARYITVRRVPCMYTVTKGLSQLYVEFWNFGHISLIEIF